METRHHLAPKPETTSPPCSVLSFRKETLLLLGSPRFHILSCTLLFLYIHLGLAGMYLLKLL